MARIYVASSWRNPYQPAIVELLRTAGHQVYDFRNPGPGNTGFHWSNIDSDWESWTPENYRQQLISHPFAAHGFMCVMRAMKWADTFVLVMPCGISAHLELGWAAGAGKRTIILLDDGEPELMNPRSIDNITSDISDYREKISGLLFQINLVEQKIRREEIEEARLEGELRALELIKCLHFTDQEEKAS